MNTLPPRYEEYNEAPPTYEETIQTLTNRGVPKFESFDTKKIQEKAKDLTELWKKIEAVNKISLWFLECKYNPEFLYCRTTLTKKYKEFY
jgi:hypothetical protein